MASSKEIVSMASLKGTLSFVENVKQYSFRMLTTTFEARFMGNAMPSIYSFLLPRNFLLTLVRYYLNFSFRLDFSYFLRR